MFLVSAKIENPRVRKSLIHVYEIGTFEDSYTIDFWGEDCTFLEAWTYDSKDERDRVFKIVDQQFADCNSPLSRQVC